MKAQDIVNSNRTHMKTFANTLLVILLLALSPAVRGAPIADGTYQATFTSANGDLFIFDLTGSYKQDLTPENRAKIDQAIADALDAIGVEGVELTLIDSLLGNVTLNYNLQMDSKGRFTGQGTITAGVARPDTITGSIVVNIGVTINGSLKTSGKVTRLKANVKLAGDATVALTYGILQVSGSATVKAPVKLELSVSGSSGRITGKASGRVTGAFPEFRKKRSWSFNESVSLTMPKSMTGGWNLLVNLTHFNKNYSGNGAITLYNGLTIPMSVTGKYSDKTGLSTLTLKGQDLFSGAKLVISGLRASDNPQDSSFLYAADYVANIMGQMFKTRPVVPQ